VSSVGLRARIVTVQNGHRHVGTVIYTIQEARQQLELEAELHQDWGWQVERFETPEHGLTAVHCYREVGRRRRSQSTIRKLSIDVYDPMTDHQSDT
jgi:hypothetical protein